MSSLILDVRTIIILLHPDNRQVLLLKRSEQKKLFPGLITGIGGKVELEQGEGGDLEKAALRELMEETHIIPDDIHNLRCRLSTLITRDGQQVVLLWFTGKFIKIPEDLFCNEGTLQFYDMDHLPFEQMVPTARQAVPFMLGLSEDDRRIYNGVFDPKSMRMITNK